MFKPTHHVGANSLGVVVFWIYICRPIVRKHWICWRLCFIQIIILWEYSCPVLYASCFGHLYTSHFLQNFDDFVEYPVRLYVHHVLGIFLLHTFYKSLMTLSNSLLGLICIMFWAYSGTCPPPPPPPSWHSPAHDLRQNHSETSYLGPVLAACDLYSNPSCWETPSDKKILLGPNCPPPIQGLTDCS